MSEHATYPEMNLAIWRFESLALAHRTLDAIKHVLPKDFLANLGLSVGKLNGESAVLVASWRYALQEQYRDTIERMHSLAYIATGELLEPAITETFKQAGISLIAMAKENKGQGET